MQRNLNAMIATVLLGALAACGGGGSDTVAAADPLAEVPPSASQSSAGLTGYMDALAAMPSDTREPLTLDNFNPSRPDDTEPEAVHR